MESRLADRSCFWATRKGSFCKSENCWFCFFHATSVDVAAQRPVYSLVHWNLGGGGVFEMLTYIFPLISVLDFDFHIFKQSNRVLSKLGVFCLFVLPSDIQNTLRKARSWAEIGGSVACKAKTLELTETMNWSQSVVNYSNKKLLSFEYSLLFLYNEDI